MQRKIYFVWIKEYNRLCPTGIMPDENINDEPSQGYGVCELAAFLWNEVQCSTSCADIWINNFIDVASSQAVDGVFGYGNAHYVVVKQDMVYIEAEFVEEQKVILTTEQAINLLRQYKEILQTNYFNQPKKLKSIEVELIAEGEEARKIMNQ